MISLTVPVDVGPRRVNSITLEVAAAGKPSAPLIILLHGFPDFWQGWRYQIAPLVEAGFRVVAPNQRGYGDSDKPARIGDYDLDVLADDVLALADSEGCPSFCVIGHDWGGIVAWWTAARRPDRVERLIILNAPHPGAFAAYAIQSPTQFLRSWYVGFFQLPWLPEWLLQANRHQLLLRALEASAPAGVFADQDRDYLRAGWAKPGGLTAMLNYYRALWRRPRASLQRRVVSPTLILFGQQDPTEEAGLARASQGFCDEAELRMLDRVWHWPQREAVAEVNEWSLQFLLDTRRSRQFVEDRTPGSETTVIRSDHSQ